MIFSQFETIGHDLCSRRLVSSHGGNLSIRMGDRLIITRRGSQLGQLKEHDLVETGINRNDRSTPMASVELPVHRAIYKETQARAIVHAHPLHAVALSVAEHEIKSDCVEGLYLLGSVPVLGWNMEVKPGGLADIVAEALKDYRVVIVRGHGTFATGQLLEEALNYTTSLEEGCEVLCLLKSMQIDPSAQK